MRWRRQRSRETIAQVHDHLWRGSQIGFVELNDFMTELCKKLKGHRRLSLHCHADSMLLSADHAIPLGLLVNELVSNAVKYAYPEGEGTIEVSARELEGQLRLEVSDQGIGLPDGFDIDQPRTSWVSRLSMAWFVRCRGISPLRPAHQEVHASW